MEKRNDEPRKKQVWLVDYDLPTNHPCTGKFYRQIKGILNENGVSLKSTKSVLNLENEETARAVHDLANKCGRSNLYEAKQVDAR